MARQPISDFVGALAEAIPLVTLKPEVESKTFEPAVAALEEVEIVTLAELLRTGAEPAAGMVRATLAAHPDFAEPNAVERAVALVFDVAGKTLTGAADAIAGEAKARDPEEAFTRADLAESGTVNAARSAINPHLKGRGLSSKALREIAESAAAARP
jgi:hypothetical protein